MKIKTPLEFQPFKDGISNIYCTDDEENKIYKYKGIRFDNRILGFKRFFAAESAKVKINKIIRIPMINNIDTYDIVEIDRDIYEIKMIQELRETNPPSMELTLLLRSD